MSFGFLLGLVFFSEQEVTFAATTHYVDANRESINLYEAPKSNAKVIGGIRIGSEITILSSSNGWSYVDMVGMKGYVYSSALKKFYKKVATTHYVNKSYIAFRNAPKQNAQIFHSLKNGTEVTVLSTSNGWSYVQYLYIRGYINSSELKKKGTSKAPATTHYVSANGDIKLRDKANQRAKTIRWIKNGTKVAVLSSSKGWSYVQIGNQKGYVYSSALKKISTPKPTASTTVTGGFKPKPGLKLTYTDDFLTDPNTKATFEIKKSGDGVIFYDTKRKGHWLYLYENKDGIGFGFTNGNFHLFHVNYPLKQGTTVRNNAPSNYGADGYRILVESTTKTVKVKAGTFKNVLILKFPNGIRYYLAKGVGVIKVRYADGFATELVSIK